MDYTLEHVLSRTGSAQRSRSSTRDAFAPPTRPSLTLFVKNLG